MNSERRSHVIGVLRPWLVLGTLSLAAAALLILIFAPWRSGPTVEPHSGRLPHTNTRDPRRLPDALPTHEPPKQPQQPQEPREVPREPAPPIVSTGELLEAMRQAYLAQDNRGLESLRVKALKRRDLELDVIREFFRDLIHEELSRHDLEPTLERAVVDVLISTWKPAIAASRKTEWFGDVMKYATDVLELNKFLEFVGGWKQVGRKSKRIEDQQRWFWRPERDLDTEGVAYMVDAAQSLAAFSSYSKPVPLVALFKRTGDYIEDRLSYAQIYVCALLVKLHARHHVTDLWKLFQDAKIAEVKAAALKAYLQLSDADAIITVAQRWADAASRAKVVPEVKYELKAMMASGVDLPEMIRVTRAFFEITAASGIRWNYYSTAITGAPLRSADLVRERESLFALLQDEDDPAMLAGWAIHLGDAWRDTNEGKVLAWLKDKFLFVLQDERNLPSIFDQLPVIGHILDAYRAVLGRQHKGECITLMEQGYEIVTSNMESCLDLTLSSLLGLSSYGRALAAYNVAYERVVPLLRAASRREVPKLIQNTSARNTRQGLEAFTNSWSALQCELAYEQLAELVESAESDEVKDYYLSVLVEWQKEADRRAGGGQD